MLFDVQAALAEILGAATATPATTATLSPKAPPASQVSQVSQSQQPAISTPAKVLPFTPSAPAPSRSDSDPSPYGRSVNGDLKTWTGRIVSLEQWRGLTDWERHGSTGKLWDGLGCQWIADEQPRQFACSHCPAISSGPRMTLLKSGWQVSFNAPSISKV